MGVGIFYPRTSEPREMFISDDSSQLPQGTRWPFIFYGDEYLAIGLTIAEAKERGWEVRLQGEWFEVLGHVDNKVIFLGKEGP